MEVKQLAQLLSESKQQKFASSPIWRQAAAEQLSWLEAALSLCHVKAAFSLMGNCGKSVLQAMLSRFGYAPVSEEKLLRNGPPDVMLSGAEFRGGMNELLEAGILFAARRGWGERYYFVAKDTFPLWHRQLFSFSEAGIADERLPGQTDRSIVQASVPPLGSQLLAAWAELSRSGGLSFTAKGKLPKKAANKAEAMLAAVGKGLHSLGVLPADQEQTPGLAFALELALRLGLMERRQERFKWNETALSEWLALPAQLREAQLYQWCRLQLLSGMPSVAHAAILAEQIAPGGWTEERRVAAYVEQIGANGIDGRGERAAAILEWFRFLQACGWLELADSSSGVLLRWRIDPKRHDFNAYAARRIEPIVVEPNGELIAFPNADYRMLWELELIADRISADRMTVYRLNAASIARAVKHGRTAAGMAAFLKQASGMPLSALVVTLVDDWSAQADRLDLKELPDSAKHPLLAIAGTGSIALPFSDTIPLSPPAGMLSVDDWEQRLELLQEDRAAQQSVFPEMETVPVSWMRQLRAYHYTTRREMIERALKWQSPVQLQMEAGIVAFVPALLEADGDGWAVRGVLRESGECRQVRLTPGMWEEMRLVMPGMNGDR